jgi:hypothetical protein
MQSSKNDFNLEDLEAVLHSAYVWLIPLIAAIALIYFTQILAISQMPNHVYGWSDFIPNTFMANMMIGTVVKYITDRFFDVYRKYKAGSQPLG